jgi:hypothetical protein
MKPTTQLFLDQEYILDGVTLTGEEIKAALIENAIMKEHFKGDSE